MAITGMKNGNVLSNCGEKMAIAYLAFLTAII
jgi:hypothetical protein